MKEKEHAESIEEEHFRMAVSEFYGLDCDSPDLRAEEKILISHTRELFNYCFHDGFTAASQFWIKNPELYLQRIKDTSGRSKLN